MIDLEDLFYKYLHTIQSNGCFRYENIFNDLIALGTERDAAEVILEIVQSSFLAGATAAAKDTLDVLGDYACSLSGIEEKVYTSYGAYDAAQESLAHYYKDILDKENDDKDSTN